MIEPPKTASEAAAMLAELIEWNDRAADFIERNRATWGDDPSDDDKYLDMTTISFDRPALDLFQRNQEAAKEGLRLVHAYLEEVGAQA